MILLIRTDMSGTPICEPICIAERENIPLPSSEYYSCRYNKQYQHVVNHSYSADDKHPIFKGMIHAIYTTKDSSD